MVSVGSALPMTTLKSKEHPVGSPGKSNRGKHEEDEDDLQITAVEGMPQWAVALQTTIMSHTTNSVDSLKVEVDEAKAMAMEAQEGVRSLRKDFLKINEMKSPEMEIQRLS